VIELRTPAEIEQMKAAGSFVGRVLQATRDAAVLWPTT
jgi:methionyl aminopeptidase